MSEKDKFPGIIAEIVREEIGKIVGEAKEELREIVRTELLPMLSRERINNRRAGKCGI